MGGGGVMRAAAKVAGIGALRGVPALPTAEHAISAVAAKSSRPVSTVILSSSDEVNSNAVLYSQPQSSEIDGWEFAGGEEDNLLNKAEPLPRLVFGSVPTMNEATEATSELKDALEKVYLSSPKSVSSDGSFMSAWKSNTSLLSNSEHLEDKARVTYETSVTPLLKNPAHQAFKLLQENPAAQTVVASIACDPNVWSAVMQNPMVMEFLKSQNTEFAPSPDMDACVGDSAVKLEGQETPNISTDSSDYDKPENHGDFFMDFLMNLKHRVVNMVSDLSGFFENLLGGSTSDDTAKATFADKAWAASPIMALAMMVIMVVMVKRG